MPSIAAARPPLFVGACVHRAGLLVGVVDGLGKPHGRAEISVETPGRIAGAVEQAVRGFGFDKESIAGIGLALPSAMDGAVLGAELARCSGLPVTLATDIDAVAHGEFWLGRGRDFQSMILLDVDATIGCSVIVDDLAKGDRQSRGGECAHMIIDCTAGARRCSCGQRGHLDGYASAAATIARAHEALNEGHPSSLRGHVADGCELSIDVLGREAESGDALALEVISQTAQYLAVGIASLLHTVDPSGVLLTGPMMFGGNETELGRNFLGWVREEVGRRAFPLLAERTVIDFGTLGEDAGYVGAAALVQLEQQKLTRA